MKIPQSIKQLKRAQLEELCARLISTNHKEVHRANDYEDKYKIALSIIENMPMNIPCEYDEKWFSNNREWCERNCTTDDNCDYCWNKYIEDRMCEHEEEKPNVLL